VPDDLPKSKFRNLPREEREVAERIVQCRRYQGKTQSDLAGLIGITRNQIASIEIARATLPFGVALKVADALGINLRWLAEGIPPASLFLTFGHSSWHGEIAADLLQKTRPEHNFLVEYKSWLRDFFHRKFSEIETHFEKDFPKSKFKDIANLMVPSGATAGSRKSILSNLEPVLNEEMSKLPPLLQYELAMKIGRLCVEFRTEYKDAIESFASSISPLARESAARRQNSFGQSMLDKSKRSPHTAGVQDEICDLKGLIERLKKVTAPRGAKAALAREFKVTRQAVNQWLSGESNPSADIAIRLQYWKPKPPAK